MTRTLCLVLTIGALGACTQAPATAPATQDIAAAESKMRADLTAWFEHHNNGNADGIAAQYAEEAILMPPNKPASVGRAAIRNFIAADTAGASAASPVGLELTGRLFTGEESARRVTPGSCMEIATGAPIPPGADAVVMVVDVVADQPPEMLFVQRDDVVEDFAAATVHPTFRGSVLPGHLHTRPLGPPDRSPSGT